MDSAANEYPLLFERKYNLKGLVMWRYTGSLIELSGVTHGTGVGIDRAFEEG